MKKWLVFALLVLTVLLVSCSGDEAPPEVSLPGVMPVPTTPEKTQTPVPTATSTPTPHPTVTPVINTPSFDTMEEAYYYKYCELAGLYGTLVLHDISENLGGGIGHSYLGGVCVVNQMDFDGDGVLDLFVVYNNGETEQLKHGGSEPEIYNFPTAEAYEYEVWTYEDGKLAPLLHEVSVSAHMYFPSDFFTYYQYFITVYENGNGLPVLQTYSADDKSCKYTNIYYAGSGIIRDTLVFKNDLFYKNGVEITESEWLENAFGYNKILLCSFLADTDNSAGEVFEYYGIDYDNTLSKTMNVVDYLSQSDEESEPHSFYVAENEYISLYLKEIFRSNWILYTGEIGFLYKTNMEHDYNLYDINRDGVPELILSDTSSGAGTHFHFFTIKNGETVDCGLYGRTSLHVDGKGGLIAYYGRMGGYIIDKLTIEDDEIMRTHIGDGQVYGDVQYPELEELGYMNYDYQKYCQPAIQYALYVYNQP